MPADDLESLLYGAGREDGAAPALRPDLAGRVRRLERRRRAARRAARAVVLGALLLGGATAAWVWSLGPGQAPERQLANVLGPPSTPAALTASQQQQLRAEIARLDAEARRLRRSLRLLDSKTTLGERLAQPAGDLLGPDPLDHARIEIEKSAFLLVDHAEQQAALAQPDLARAEYQRVLSAFPNTRAAQTARERIVKLPNEKGDH